MSMKYKRIHITGASGSGTTTLGKEMNERLGFFHIDIDDVFWMPTDPPYQIRREREKRQEILIEKFNSNERWVTTGCVMGWGDFIIPEIDLCVYLWIPAEIRIERLKKREIAEYGEKETSKGGKYYEQYKWFIEWASHYDDGKVDEGRTKEKQEAWMKKLTCPVLRIEGNYTIEEKIEKMMNFSK